MAKTAVNKAAEIRAYLSANPKATGVEVVAALGKKGIKVAPAQVSNVKTAMKKKSGKKVRATGGSDGVGIKQILDAAFVLLDKFTADEAADILSRLEGGKKKAK